MLWRWLWVVTFWTVTSCFVLAEFEGIYTSPPLSPAQRETVMRRLQARWEQIQKKPGRMGVRELF
ncbi:MAG: hypothetical protein ACK40X_14890, partial [Armatimonadota bacterium]